MEMLMPQPFRSALYFCRPGILIPMPCGFLVLKTAHSSTTIRLSVLSDWGCEGQAVPRAYCRSRGSLASLRGRRVAAA